MSDIIKDFQDKHHPCAKCCVRICCTSYCEPRDIYHTMIYEVIQSHFDWHTKQFQFCFGKLAYFDISDLTAKKLMLMRPIKTVRQLSSKGSMFTMIMRDMIKKFENGL